MYSRFAFALYRNIANFETFPIHLLLKNRLNTTMPLTNTQYNPSSAILYSSSLESSSAASALPSLAMSLKPLLTMELITS